MFKNSYSVLDKIKRIVIGLPQVEREQYQRVEQYCYERYTFRRFDNIKNINDLIAVHLSVKKFPTHPREILGFHNNDQIRSEYQVDEKYDILLKKWKIDDISFYEKPGDVRKFYMLCFNEISKARKWLLQDLKERK